MVSRTIANDINGALFGRQGQISAPNTWYFGLCTAEPTINESGDGVINGELSNSTGYQRVAIANTTTNFNAPAHTAEMPLSYISNKTVIEMPVITGGGDVDVAYFFLSRNSSGSTCDVWGRFTKVRHLSIDSQLIIPAGAAVFELTNAAQ